jgi:hypothetical protein
VPVEILHGLTDERAADNFAAREIRMPEVHARPENGHFDSSAIADSERHTASRQAPARTSDCRLLVYFDLRLPGLHLSKDGLQNSRRSKQRLPRRSFFPLTRYFSRAGAVHVVGKHKVLRVDRCDGVSTVISSSALITRD